MTVNEQLLLHDLGIKSWREMSKAKIVKFASNLHKMDPEVAKAAIAQFPHYAELANAMINSYKETAIEVMRSNETTVKVRMEAYISVLNSLQKQLEFDELTDDSRQHINECMVDIAREIGDIDHDNKAFLMGMLRVAGGVALGMFVLCGSALGIALRSRNSNT